MRIETSSMQEIDTSEEDEGAHWPQASPFDHWHPYVLPLLCSQIQWEVRSLNNNNNNEHIDLATLLNSFQESCRAKLFSTTFTNQRSHWTHQFNRWYTGVNRGLRGIAINVDNSVSTTRTIMVLGFQLDNGQVTLPIQRLEKLLREKSTTPKSHVETMY